MENIVHELSIMSNILDIVLKHAEQNRAKKVRKVSLRIGALSDIIPEWAQSYFDMLSKDTIAENAELDIEKVPAVIECRSCMETFEMKPGEWKFSCAKCESADIQIVSGREFTVWSIEVE